MTDNQVLVLILLLVYLSECVAWVPNTAAAFQFSRPRRGKVNAPGKGLGNDRGRFVLSHPIPMLAGIHIVSYGGRNVDAAAAASLWEGFRRTTRWLRFSAFVCFLLLFGLIPVVWKFYRADTVQMLAAFLLLLFVCSVTGVLHFHAHQNYFPKQRWDRWQQSIFAALVPTHASRAHDTLGRDLLKSFHPLIIAELALPKESFQQFATKWLREATHPLPGHPPTDLTQVEPFLTAQGITLSPPQAEDGATQYCPRCHALFSPAASVCEDCQNLPLAGFGEMGR